MKPSSRYKKGNFIHMTIHLLKESDLQALYHFEKENRLFFQSIGLGRNDCYYELHTFKEIVKALIEDQNKDLMYAYFVKLILEKATKVHIFF